MERGKFSVVECRVLVAICIISFLSLMFVPALYAEVTGKTVSAESYMVPEVGTVEYQQYVQDFEAKYGREWTIDDDMAALKMEHF